MSTPYCPALTRVGDKFVCRITNSEVDPGLLPCLSDYATCPIYLRAKAAGPGAAPEVATEAPPSESSVGAPPAVAEAIEVAPLPPPSEVPERVEEDVLAQLETIERDLRRLDTYWAEYERATRDVLKRWDEAKESVLRRLSSIDHVIQSLAEERKELDTWREVGLITEEYYDREVRELEERVAKLEEERGRLVEYLERLEQSAEAHRKRVVVASASAEISRLKLSLAKLEQLFESGEIDEETYERVRSEIEEQIKRLQRFL